MPMSVEKKKMDWLDWKLKAHLYFRSLGVDLMFRRFLFPRQIKFEHLTMVFGQMPIP